MGVEPNLMYSNHSKSRFLNNANKTIVLFCWLFVSGCGQKDTLQESVQFKIVVPKIKYINGKPDPAILAEKQVLRKGNGSQHGINDSAYNNPEYDYLLKQSANTFDPQERLKIMYKAEQTILKDQPIMPIFSYVIKRLIKPYVGGVGENIMDHHYSKDWFILKHKTIKVGKTDA